jgi:NTP pyrophosphatase (non-canonical NTP hydrolase)
MGKYKALSSIRTLENNYTKDPLTLTLGICEEAGEIAKSVNWYWNPLYIHSPNTKPPDDVKHEVEDLLIYVAALCEALHINIEI